MEIKLIICFSCVIPNTTFQRLKILLVTLSFFIVEYIFLKQFVKLLMVKCTYLLTYWNWNVFNWIFFLGSSHKGKENISMDNWTDLGQNKISELYIRKNKLCLCKQKNICMSVWLHLRKVHLRLEKNYWYFSLFS